MQQKMNLFARNCFHHRRKADYLRPRAARAFSSPPSYYLLEPRLNNILSGEGKHSTVTPRNPLQTKKDLIGAEYLAVVKRSNG